jgi:hypothetical protein
MGTGSVGNYSVKIKQTGYNGGDNCFATDPAAFVVMMKTNNFFDIINNNMNNYLRNYTNKYCIKIIFEYCI